MTKQMTKDDLLYRLKETQKSHYLTQAELAREIGISDSTLSQLFNGTYKGNEETMLKQVEGWLTPIIDPQSIDIVHTSTFDALCEYFAEAYNRHCIYAVTGKSGFGKTAAAKFYSKVRLRAYWIPGRANMGGKHLMQEIATVANINNARGNSVYELQNRIMQHFSTRSALLIIDEADKLGVKTLDALREIYDLGTVGLILIGEPSLPDKLRQRDRSGLSLERLYNRIDEFYEVSTISKENVVMFLKHHGFTEVPGEKFLNQLVDHINYMGGYRRLAKVVEQVKINVRLSGDDTRSLPRNAVIDALAKFPA